MPGELMGTNVWARSFAGVELARMMTRGQGPDRQADYAAASPCQTCNALRTVLALMLGQQHANGITINAQPGR